MKYLFVFIFYDSAGQLGVACSVNSAVVKKNNRENNEGCLRELCNPLVMCGSNSPGRASAFTRPLVQKANGYSGVSGVIIDTTGRYVSIVLVGKKYIMAHCIDVIARQTRNEKGEAY